MSSLPHRHPLPAFGLTDPSPLISMLPVAWILLGTTLNLFQGNWCQGSQWVALLEKIIYLPAVKGQKLQPKTPLKLAL